MPLTALPSSAQLALPGMTDVTSGLEAQARMFDVGVAGASSVADTLNKQAANKAQLSGAVAGSKAALQYDAQGNLLPLSQLPEDGSIYSKAYREAAISLYGTTAVAQSRTFAKILASDPQNRQDTKRFRDQWNAYQTETLSKLHPLVAAAITPQLVETGGTVYGDLVDAHATAVLNDAAIGLEGNLTSSAAEWMQRLDKMGDTPAARTYIDNQLQTQFLPIAKQLNATNGSKYGWEALRGKLRGLRQQLYGAMAGAQAAQFGAALTTQPDGSITGDETAKAAYLDKLRNDPTLAGVFTQDEFKTQIEGPVNARFGLAETGSKTQRLQQAVTADATIAGTVGQLHTEAAGALAGWKTSFDFSGIKAVELKAASTDFDRDPVKSTQQRLAFLNDLNDKVLAELSDPSAREQMRLLSIALDPKARGTARFPDNRAGTQALLKAQLAWDSYVAAEAPGTVLSAAMDPGLFAKYEADPHAGFIAATGRISPRAVAEMQGSLSNLPVETANNIFANYQTLLKVAPDELKASLGSDGVFNMQLWGDAGGKPEEYTRLKSIANGGQVHSWREQAADQVWKDYGDHPENAGKALANSLATAISNTSTIVRGAKAFLGFPNDPSTIIPEAYHEGWLGLAIPTDGLKRALGYVPVGDLRINYSPDALSAFKAASAQAAFDGTRGEGASTLALADMANQNYGISKLLMPTGLDVGQPGQWRDLSADFVYGKYGPESFYKVSAYTLAADISIAAVEWAKQPSVQNAYKSADPLIFGDQRPLGVRGHWFEEYRAGRLKMEVVPGVGGRPAGYNVWGLVLNQYQHQWIPLNPPGQPYNFDPANGYLARLHLTGAAEGRAAGLAVEGAIGDTPAGHIAGAVAATATHAGIDLSVRTLESDDEMAKHRSQKLDDLLHSLFGSGRQGLDTPPSDLLKGE